MPTLIEDPPDCEIPAVICFFSAKDVKLVKIH